MTKELISERIKNSRENLGITMTEAARRLGLSKIGYCRYEYGDRTPSPQTLKIIAMCFHTSTDYLTGKTDDISPDSITVFKKENPELFEFVHELQNKDIHTIQRLVSYYSKINEISKKENF